MARARLLKPGFFKNETLAHLRPPKGAVSGTTAAALAARLCFEGLWVLADREGRLEDRPLWIKAETFPYDHVDVEPLLTELEAHGFICRYAANGHRYIEIPKFLRHQSPHIREQPSTIPAAGQHGSSTVLEQEQAMSSPSVPVLVPVPVPIPVPESVPVSKDQSSPADAGRQPPPDDADQNVGVITKIAHEAITLLGPHHLDLRETVKSLCAQRHITYNSTVVTKAIESATVQRRRA